MRRLALGLAFVLAGCGATPIVDYTKMSADQITAVVRDKTAVGNCLKANTPYGTATSTYIAIDKAAVAAGGTVAINAECQITFTNGAPSQPMPVVIQDAPGSFRLLTPLPPAR